MLFAAGCAEAAQLRIQAQGQGTAMELDQLLAHVCRQNGSMQEGGHHLEQTAGGKPVAYIAYSTGLAAEFAYHQRISTLTVLHDTSGQCAQLLCYL
jgi:hypothetical protein